MLLPEQLRVAVWSLDDSVWKPLGRGYERFPGFFLEYCRPPGANGGNPTLAMSLDAYLPEAASSQIIRLGGAPRCLIQGLTCPFNGTALREFLGRLGVPSPEIQAIDIMDTAALARAAGFPLKGIEFRVRDATALGDWPDGAFDLIVQDHLLNCAPHRQHDAILGEAARLLSPEGVLLCNFSLLRDDRPREGDIDWRDAEHLLEASLNNGAYCLADLAAEPRLAELKTRLLGRVISGGEPRRQVQVTRPHGNFEFYFGLEELHRTLRRVGLRFSYQAKAGVCVDYTRHHTLIRRAEVSG